MKQGKRFSLFLVWIILTINTMLAFVVPVYADFGPKPSIELTILNAPSEYFCIALFIRGEPHKEEELEKLYELKHKKVNQGGMNHKDAFTELTEKMFQQEGNGYQVAVKEGGQRCFLEDSSDYRFKEYNYFDFVYGNTPETFKICVVTKDNCVISNQELTRTRFSCKAVFDYETGELYEDLEQYAKDDKNLLINLFYYFFVTIVIEGIILILFGLISKRNVVIFLIMNLLTQTYLQFYCWKLYKYGLQHGSMLDDLQIFGVELVITFVETLVYAIAMKAKDGKRWKCIVYGILANFISAFLGFIIP